MKKILIALACLSLWPQVAAADIGCPEWEGLTLGVGQIYPTPRQNFKYADYVFSGDVIASDVARRPVGDPADFDGEDGNYLLDGYLLHLDSYRKGRLPEITYVQLGGYYEHFFYQRGDRILDVGEDVLVFAGGDSGTVASNGTCDRVQRGDRKSYTERRLKTYRAATPKFDYATSTAALPRDLSRGSTGDDVAALQAFLDELGFISMPKSVPGGYFGAVTEAGVKAFQEKVGLNIDGRVEGVTRTHLSGALEMWQKRVPRPAYLRSR